MKNNVLRPAMLKSFLIKEFKQILRDKRMRGMVFGSPVIMLLIFGYAVNTDIAEIRMVVLDSDRTSESRGMIHKFTSCGYFKI